MTDTTQPHPEPSEEASSLPVVAWFAFASGELYHTKDGIPFRHLPPVGEIHALVLLSDAQSQLNAMRAGLERKSDAIQKLWKERDEARAELAAAREHLARSEGLLAIAIKQNENADRRALKAAPVVDVEAILRLAEKMMRDSWATGEDSAWHPARDELRAALASPEGSPR